MEEHVILAVPRVSWSEMLEMSFSLLLRASWGGWACFPVGSGFLRLDTVLFRPRPPGWSLFTWQPQGGRRARLGLRPAPGVASTPGTQHPRLLAQPGAPIGAAGAGELLWLVFLFSVGRVDGSGPYRPLAWGWVVSPCDPYSGLTFCPGTPLLTRGTCVLGEQQLVNWFPTLFLDRRGGYPTMAGFLRLFGENWWLTRGRQGRVETVSHRQLAVLGSERRPDSRVSGLAVWPLAALPLVHRRGRAGNTREGFPFIQNPDWSLYQNVLSGSEPLNRSSVAAVTEEPVRPGRDLGPRLRVKGQPLSEVLWGFRRV